MNLQERCLDLDSWVSDATYLDRIHFPGISDVLVDNGPFALSEWRLLTASDDNLGLTSAEQKPDPANVIGKEVQARVRCICISPVESECTLE